MWTRKNGCIGGKTGDLETNWINWLPLRAGSTRTWQQRSIGEQVVLLSLGGNLETAFALLASYSDAFPPPDYIENSTTAVFKGGDRDVYTSVIASWLHTRGLDVKPETTVKRKRRKSAAQKKEPEAKQGDYLIGTDDDVLVMSRTYANRANAERAAKMQWERLQRWVATFSIQLARGRADLYTEMPVKVSGFKQMIDAGEWIITTLMHSLSAENGYTTSIELEVKIDSLAME
ncbi:phage baseplate assembly protein V [Pantoea dispersa]|uniref:phage baseplate assembly protein V n=1 Tax=Pantoea dispersa TaxID=59814 RepID=UPI001CA6DDBA|nr:phage baseplate assembly protein V [Pantoea dispersa]QZY90821.1 phage baseplate assembly protein V [Pantoea dispersa]